jgi:hypothetical protein
MTTTETLARLREPFAANQINKLPKPYKADSKKGNCRECGGYHGLPALHLDYVGHAALTNRFLDVDPGWSWEPVAFGDDGLPAFDKLGGLWIRLTICGVTRLGYGDAQGKTGPNAVKEAIGDALRNAGMRFGAALDLWHKGDLHDAAEQREQQPAPESAPDEQEPPFDEETHNQLLTAIDGAETRESLATLGASVAKTPMPTDARDALRKAYTERMAGLASA